jgi:hypothetical protein
MSQKEQLTRLQDLLKNLPEPIPHHDHNSAHYTFSVAGGDLVNTETKPAEFT